MPYALVFNVTIDTDEGEKVFNMTSAYGYPISHDKDLDDMRYSLRSRAETKFRDLGLKCSIKNIELLSINKL